METNRPLTVRELAEACAELIRKGHSDKQILISDDDEGNGYHSLFFGFIDNKETIRKLADYGLFHDNQNPKDVVILG